MSLLCEAAGERQDAGANVTADMIAVFMQVRDLQSSRILRKVLQCSWALWPVNPQQPYQSMMFDRTCGLVALCQSRPVLGQALFRRRARLTLQGSAWTSCRKERMLMPTMWKLQELLQCHIGRPAKKSQREGTGTSSSHQGLQGRPIMRVHEGHWCDILIAQCSI